MKAYALDPGRRWIDLGLMTLHLTQHRAGFGPGHTLITNLDEIEDTTGIAFSIHRLAAKEPVDVTTEKGLRDAIRARVLEEAVPL